MLLIFRGLVESVAGAALSLSGIWDGESGLPNPVVNVVFQSRVGDLWCGTYYGLARFDGVRFKVLEPYEEGGLAGRGVTALHEDRKGVIWVGMGNGELGRVEGRERLRSLAVVDPAGEEVRSIAEDLAGDLWVLWNHGRLMRVRDGRQVDVPEAVKPGEPELQLVNDGEGRLWLTSRAGFYEVTDGGLVAAAAGISEEDGWLQRAAGSQRGGLWVVVGLRLKRWNHGRWIEDLPCGWWGEADEGANRYVTAMKELRDGRLLIGMIEGGAGVGRPGGVFQRFGREQGLSHEWVRCVGEDREGNLWLGTGGGGVAALRPQRVEMVEVERTGARHNLQSIAMAADGGVWVGTEGGGAWHLREASPEGIAEGFVRVESDGSPYVWSVEEDGSGRMWLGSWDGDLEVREKGGERFEAAPGWPGGGGPVRLILAASDGALWVGGRELRCLRDGVWVHEDGAGRSLAPMRQVSIAEDVDGAIWVGIEDGTVVRRLGDEVEIFGREDGFPGEAVMAILPQGEGTVWMGTMGGGLLRFRDGRAVAVTERHGFPSMVVSQLLEDGTGNLWAGTREGICRVGFDVLNACADGLVPQLALLVLSRADGLATMGCSAGGQPGCGRTADGRLWFATNRGLAVVDPQAIRMNLLPPPVVIESVTADRGEAGRKDGGRLVFGPGPVSCTISYSGLSFVAPERVRFRTRLLGLENEWQEAGGERSAVYRYLRSGDYKFEVVAANNDGVWNHVGAGVAFTVRPHWWQTVWFRVAGLLMAGLAVGWIFRAMERRRNAVELAGLERSHALELERARIARDIHDDLGSGLTRISLLSRQVLEEISPEGPASEEIGQIGRAAERLTQAMDEIVWAVDPRHDSLDSLVGYVGSAAQEMVSAAGMRFRLEAPSDVPAWPLTADRRHGLFLAFKEAMHNVVRHSGARLVRVIFVVERDGFTLAVEDDGCGYDAAAPPTRVGGGRGMEHMKRRMAEAGGTFEAGGGAGSGTRITFRIPVTATHRSTGPVESELGKGDLRHQAGETAA